MLGLNTPFRTMFIRIRLHLETVTIWYVNDPNNLFVRAK